MRPVRWAVLLTCAVALCATAPSVLARGGGGRSGGARRGTRNSNERAEYLEEMQHEGFDAELAALLDDATAEPVRRMRAEDRSTNPADRRR